jgi:hypothetical protein
MNEIRNLTGGELDAVSGGVIAEAMDYAKGVGTCMGVIAGIGSVLTAAVDSIPPASCHPKT